MLLNLRLFEVMLLNLRLLEVMLLNLRLFIPLLCLDTVLSCLLFCMTTR